LITKVRIDVQKPVARVMVTRRVVKWERRLDPTPEDPMREVLVRHMEEEESEAFASYKPAEVYQIYEEYCHVAGLHAEYSKEKPFGD
jgi:hypothetical protein